MIRSLRSAESRRLSPSIAAFTLLELMVVFAIIGLLLAFLLPAVSRARAAASRTQCANHLKQIGIALHSYQTSNGVFPTSIANHGLQADWKGILSRLLAELGQEAVYNSVNFSVVSAFVAAENQTAAQTHIDEFLCPADPYNASGRFGPNNYRANYGALDNEGSNKAAPGAFTFYAWLKPQSFVDGLATTVGFSEKLKGDGEDKNSQGSFHKESEFLFLGLFFANSLPPDDAAQLCESANPSALLHGSRGGDTWFLTGFANGLYNHVFAPNHEFSDCSYFGVLHREEDQVGVFAARSHHPHGVNCVMMDGSVRFISNEIDLHVWRSIGSRAGGELISNTEF